MHRDLMRSLLRNQPGGTMNFRISKLFTLAAIATLASFAAQAQTIITQIPLDSEGYIQGIAANPTTNQIYASILTFNSTNDELAVIDGKSP